jgi:hypothetical protein
MVKYQIESEELGFSDIEIEVDNLEEAQKTILSWIDFMEVK